MEGVSPFDEQVEADELEHRLGIEDLDGVDDILVGRHVLVA